MVPLIGTPCTSFEEHRVLPLKSGEMRRRRPGGRPQAAEGAPPPKEAEGSGSELPLPAKSLGTASPGHLLKGSTRPIYTYSYI